MTLAATDLPTLIGLARDGDVVAFAEFVRRHQSAVYAVALSTVSDRSLAEDAAQEAFLIAWKTLDKLEQQDRAAAWLCGIARNVARKLVRKGARERVSETDDLDDARTDDGSPLRELLQQEAVQSIEELVGGVSPRYREPIVLHYGADQSVAEIAACLQLSEAAVKQRLSRGRMKLRERAERFGELAHACRVPAVLAPAIIATLSAKTVAAQAAKASSVIAPLTFMGVAMKKSLILVGVALLCVASFVGYRSLRASTPAPLAEQEESRRAAPAEAIAAQAGPNQRAQVKGRVVDGESGAAIAGAIVLPSALGSGELSRDADLLRMLPETAVTDDQGQFALQLPPGRYQFTASAPGYLAKGAQSLELGSGGAEDIELTLLAGGVRLHGSISDVGGGPIAGALVRAIEAPNSIQLPTSAKNAVVTDTEGRFELWLKPGNYALAAQHLDYSTLESEIMLGKSERELDLQLVPATTVEGIVRRIADKQPVPGAIVSVAGASNMIGISDSEGRFRFQRLAAGTLTLQARSQGAVSASPTTMELDIGATHDDVELWLEPGANVSGQVFDERGDKVAGAAVSLFDMATEIEFPAKGHTDEAGYFVIEGIAPGSYSAVVHKDTRPMLFLRDAIVVASEDVTDVKLVMADAGALRGHVRPAGPASVYLVRGGGEGAMGAMALGGDMSDYINMATAQTRTMADGSFTIAGVAHGDYKLIAIADDGLQGGQDVQVGESAEVTVSMSPGWTLEGRLSTTEGRTPTGSVQLQLESMDHFPAIYYVAILDERGHFALKGLRGGAYQVSVSDPQCQRELEGEASGILHVPADVPSGRLQREFVVTQCGRVLRGRVVDTSGQAVRDAWIRVAGSDAAGAVALSDNEGDFELTNMHSGPLVLHGYHPAMGSAQGSVEASEANPVLRLQQSPSLKVSARFDGDELSRFESKLVLGTTRTNSSSARDGEALHDHVSPGTYLLEVSSDKAVGSRSVTLQWAQEKTLEVPMQAWAQLKGVVTTADGEPAAGYSVTPLHSAFASTEYSQEYKEGLVLLVESTKTDSAGGFELQRVRPDSLMLMLASPEGEFCVITMALEAGHAKNLGPVGCNQVSEREDL